MEKEEVREIIKKETKGQKARRIWGIGGSVIRAMRKNGLDINAFSDSFAAYREVRKKRRKEAAKVRSAKRDRARAGKRDKSDSKTPKKKK